jgi:hypothetical protein
MSSQNLFCSSHDKADNLSHVVKKITLFLFTVTLNELSQLLFPVSLNCSFLITPAVNKNKVIFLTTCDKLSALSWLEQNRFCDS